MKMIFDLIKGLLSLGLLYLHSVGVDKHDDLIAYVLAAISLLTSIYEMVKKKVDTMSKKKKRIMEVTLQISRIVTMLAHAPVNSADVRDLVLQCAVEWSEDEWGKFVRACRQNNLLGILRDEIMTPFVKTEIDNDRTINNKDGLSWEKMEESAV